MGSYLAFFELEGAVEVFVYRDVSSLHMEEVLDAFWVGDVADALEDVGVFSTGLLDLGDWSGGGGVYVWSSWSIVVSVLTSILRVCFIYLLMRS